MRALILTAALVAAATPALAGTAVTLRPNATDADGVVTLGDLFDGAGAAATVPVARRTSANLLLDAAAVQAAARRAGLDWANAAGMRRIVVSGEAAASAGAPAARGNVDVLTWARNIPAGEVVQPQDLVWAKAAAAPADAPNDPEALIGQAARHALRQGGVATARDVAQVQVIKAKDVITVTYEAGGVSLALQGVALSSGGVGDAINVQNPSSKKILQAVVTGPGQALVGPAASQLKANPSRIALR